MKPRLTSASATLAGPSNQDGMAALAHPRTNGARAGRTQKALARPQLTLASAPAWNHKLILKGRLDRRTVVELEDEIECLCEEGVTVLTLDLRQLDAIDSAGASAIAWGGLACKQRGRGFTVVPGSPAVHRALSEAGTEGLLADDAGPERAPAFATSASDGSSGDTSTVMIKNL